MWGVLTEPELSRRRENKDPEGKPLPKERMARPLPKGALAWYVTKHPRDSKYHWYVPVIVKSYIPDGKDKKRDRVKGYVLKADTDTLRESLDKKDKAWIHLEKQLKHASARLVIARWDRKKIPSCPIPEIESSHKRSKLSSTDIVAQATKEFGSNLGFTGATQQIEKDKYYGPEKCGITMEQLEAIRRHEKYKRGMTMRDVVNEIIKPITKKKSKGYALLINRKKPLRAKIMVSHGWDEGYETFLSALQDSRVKGPYWVCAMAIYQNEDDPKLTIDKQLGKDPSTGPFATVLKQAKTMVAVITPECNIYTRLWCVYEMYVAAKLGVPVKLISTSTKYDGAYGTGKIYYDPLVASCDQAIDTRSAFAYPNDRAMIHKEIKTFKGGFDAIDDVVSWLRLNCLIKERRTVGMEPMREVPIGVCTSSCAEARWDAAIAKALQVRKG